MNNSKRKFLYNLIKVQTLKKEHTRSSHYEPTIKMLHSLFVLYFIVINTDDGLRNPIFAAIKSFHTILSQFQQINTILASLILSIGLCMITSFLYLSLGNDKFTFQRNRVKVEKVILKGIVWLSLFFDLIVPILLVFVISNLGLNGLESAFKNTLNILCIVLSEVIIVYCNNYLIYSYKFVFLLLAFQLIDGLLPYCIAIALTFYQLFSAASHKLPYLLVLVITIITFCSKAFEADIGTINTLIIFVSITLINSFLPQDHLILNNVAQNDFLLQRIRKLSNDEELSDQQFFKITLFLQDTQIRHKELISKMQQQAIAKFSSKKISKTDLISLAMMKIDIDVKANPNDLSIIIQRHECRFLSKTFTIKTLYEIERLNMEVQNRCTFDELYRMQAFLNKVQAQYLQNQDDMSSALILRTDKKIQYFYTCLGLCVEQLLSIWTTTSKGIINEQIFSKSLKKVMFLEAQAYQILKELKKLKNIAFEIDILNFLHRMVNVDGQNLMEANHFISQEKLKETKFILVSNQIIEDLSQIIAKTVSNNKQSLVGLSISQILFDFYSVFLQEQMTCNRSLFQTHDAILIPFKILDHQKRFFLSQCVISILPDLTIGVKYMINFVKPSQSIKKYALYCLQDDIIQGFSQSFYEVYKINEFLFPDILFGRQVFNIDINKHINESKMSKNIILKCDLMVKDFYDKKKVKRTRQHNSIPLLLKIRDIYKVKNLHYILFEMQTNQKTLISNTKETIKMFVKQNTDGHPGTSEIIGQTFCKINNPLQSTIDDRLSRINNHFRVFTYFKIIIYILSIAFLLILGSLIYIKLITEKIGVNFENQLTITTKTNALAKVVHLLYYQYYQYYQIENYPEQILSIQPYDVPAIIKEYKIKTNENIVSMLPYILSNHASATSETYTKIFSTYVQEETTAAINLVDFLQSTKTALTTNSPVFLVKNKQVADKIINSFRPLDNQMMEQFKQDMLKYLLGSFVGIVIICSIIKIIYFRICFFKWKLFKIYLEIGEEELVLYTTKLKDFVDVLVQTKYYDRRQQISDTFVAEEIRKTHEKDMTSIQVSSLQTQQVKGIKKSSYMNKLTNKNLVVLIPILTLFFFMFYFDKISSFTQESDLILDYTKSLQTFSIVLLQRTTEYFQEGMEAILPQTERQTQQKATVLKLPTRLDTDLPSYFDSYKQIEKGMLDFNLCKYSYLNTGSLYKNINCSQILDGIMDKSFTQSYSFILQQLSEFKGAKIQDFGKQFRPKAKYPFYMQVCYARRTINNMLAFIQGKFNTTLSGYARYRQTIMQSIINIGFLIIPIMIAVIIFFLRQIKSQCGFAVKCFKILPRRFIMKISMSKKLKNIGILDEIEMVAA